jgi:hypothetical protein
LFTDWLDRACLRSFSVSRAARPLRRGQTADSNLPCSRPPPAGLLAAIAIAAATLAGCAAPG